MRARANQSQTKRGEAPLRVRTNQSQTKRRGASLKANQTEKRGTASKDEANQSQTEKGGASGQRVEREERERNKVGPLSHHHRATRSDNKTAATSTIPQYSTDTLPVYYRKKIRTFVALAERCLLHREEVVPLKKEFHMDYRIWSKLNPIIQ